MMKEEKKKIMEDIDEAEEETLSLFEYSMNTAVAESEWEDYYSTSIINHDQEQHYFEFCSNEWSSSTVASSNAPENIIFCGKIISYQEPISGNDQNSQTIKGNTRKKPGLMFPWKSKRKDNTISARRNRKEESNKSLSISESRKFSVHKISVVASPGKFRWYLLFGMARFPMEMALTDIKNRQSRRIPSSTLFRMEGAESKKMNISTRSRGKGLWRQLRHWVLGTTTKQAS